MVHNRVHTSSGSARKRDVPSSDEEFMNVDSKGRRMSIMKIELVVQKSITDVNPDGKGRINRNRAHTTK